MEILKPSVSSIPVHGNCLCRSWSSSTVKIASSLNKKGPSTSVLLPRVRQQEPGDAPCRASDPPPGSRSPPRCLHHPAYPSAPVDWTIVCHLLAVPVLHDGGEGTERSSWSRWRRQPKAHTSSPLPTPSSTSRNFSSYICPTFYIKFLEDTLEYTGEELVATS